MNLLDIRTKEKSISIHIDSLKILVYKDFSIPNLIHKCVKHVVEKEEISEYEEENNVSAQVMWNEQKIETKRWTYFNIHQFIDLNEEVKLGSKSILLNFIESNLREIEYSDIFNMINQSIEALNEDLIQEKTRIEIGDFEVFGRLKLFTLKSIVKLIEVQMMLDESWCNEYDMDVDLKIEMLVNVVCSIAKNNRERNYITFVDIRSISQEELTQWREKIPDNLILLFCVSDLKGAFNTREVLLCNGICVDLDNSEQRFNSLIMDHGVSEDPDSLTDYLDTLFSDTCLHRHEINQLLHRL